MTDQNPRHPTPAGGSQSGHAIGHRGGEYEPIDSRNVTGTSANPTGDRWSKDAQATRPLDAAGQPEAGPEGAKPAIDFEPDAALEEAVATGNADPAAPAAGREQGDDALSHERVDHGK